ncbi:TrmH family RNA methyltransferase [Alteribacillus sp. HJP-4]|uniref:TrmH family RNA methyltransferase n=1 Tax=Alteribacillus sp. HJP-4 TaxID=2775394 RepID=UPI0035CD224B
MNRIESIKNPKIKHIKKLRRRSVREKENLFLIEGIHLIEEAIQADITIDELYVEETKQPHAELVTNSQITLVTEAVMKEMSTLETPSGFLAVCELPEKPNTAARLKGTYLFVDGVQDPGNLGTMIRTADAAGVDAVILGEGTVDPYNDKVIRSTQGSLFHVPVIKADLGDWIAACKDKNIPVFGTSLTAGTSHTAIESQQSFALVVGNEGSGVKEEWLENSDQTIYVPIYGKAESLNVSVATGILLYHLRSPAL